MACSSGKAPEVQQRRLQHLSGPPVAMDALGVLLETARVLRSDGPAFAATLLFLLCPASAALLSGALVDPSLARALSRRAALLAASSGLPLTRFVEQVCGHVVATLLSATSCFPLLLTFFLLARASIAYSVACCYAGKRALASEFLTLIRKIWRNLVSTYLCSCGATLSCLGLFLFLLIATCNAFSLMGFPPDLVAYPALLILLAFAIVYARVVIVCSIAGVISVLEERCGMEALLTAVQLVRGQTQVGFLIFLGSAIGMSLVEGVVEHRVRSLSYGEGASMVWEGPLLVFMYSAVVLVDSMMSAVFYFTCRSSNIGEFDGGGHSSADLKLLSSWSASI